VTTRPRRRAPGTATSRSRPPASPTLPAQARGLTRAGFPLAPPGGGASSSATSITAARSPAEETSAGDADATTTDTAAAVTAAASSSCGPMATAVSRGASPVAVALTAASEALDERLLVVTDAPDLSALTVTREGRSAPPCEQKNTRMSTSPSKSRVHRGSATHLRLEKPCFPFLEGSGGTAVAPASASAALASSSTDNLVAGAPRPPQALTSPPPPRPVVTKAEDSTSRGRPPSHSSFDDGPADVPRAESPCCLRSRYSSLYCSRCSHRRSLLSLACATRSCSHHCAARAADRARLARSPSADENF
jgi:hypothetical protein